MRFEWDENKNASNRRKHRVDFDTARLVFEDAFHVTDEAKTVKGEKRWITVGSVEGIIIVAVLHTDRGRPPDGAIRIMSARPASRRERKRYEQVVKERAGAVEGISRSTG